MDGKGSNSPKVLISIVGRGQRTPTGEFDYFKTNYQFEDSQIYNTKLVGHALWQKYKFDRVYMVGTSQSLWRAVEETIGKGNYKKVLIPFGKSYKEFWEMFETFTKLEVEGAEIHFDITHGFRSIPIFISTLLNFFTKVREATIAGVYYGMYEAKDIEKNITPVINMLPFLEMNRWVDGFYLFKKYGDGREIGEILEEKFSQIPNQQKRNFNYLKKLAQELQLYSQSTGFSAVRLYQLTLSKIGAISTNISNLPISLNALNFLLEDLKNESEVFKGIEKRWQQDFKTAKLLFEKNRYAQSLTILRETLLTYLLEESGLVEEIYNFRLREEVLGKLIMEEGNRLKKHKPPLYFSADFLALMDQIRGLRNKSNHAFIKEDLIEERSIKKVVKKGIRELRTFLNRFEELTQKDKILLNRSHLEEILKNSK